MMDLIRIEIKKFILWEGGHAIFYFVFLVFCVI